MSGEGPALPVYVLIGGESRRFGADKASHPIDGVPWAVDIGRRLAGGDGYTLVGPEPPTGVLEAERFLRDAPKATGPLTGVAAALADRLAQQGEGLLVIASCDLVRPDPAWIEPLIAVHEADDKLDVAAYRTADRWQPFPCVAHTRWRERLAETLTEGVRSFQAAFDAAEAAAVGWLDAAGPTQANTPEELAAAMEP